HRCHVASLSCKNTVLGSERTLEQLRRGCYAVRRPQDRIFPRLLGRLCDKTPRGGRAPRPSTCPIVGQPHRRRGFPRWLVTASTSFGRMAITLLRERDMRCRVETTLIGLA